MQPRRCTGYQRLPQPAELGRGPPSPRFLRHVVQHILGPRYRSLGKAWEQHPPFGLLLLLLLLLLPSRLLRAEEEDLKVQALVGESVALPCIYPQTASFELDDLYVYWQITVGKMPKTVAWHLGGNSEDRTRCEPEAGCEQRPGAELVPADMQRGNFTLRLADVSPQDEQSYQCLVFKRSQGIEEILRQRVTLRVAGNYSTPVVTSQEPTAEGELVFTCTSGNGYPQPTVYWINLTDCSLLAEDLQNSTVRLNALGLYDVLSVLRLGRAGPAQVDCCVENTLLGPNVSCEGTGVSLGSLGISTTPRSPEGTRTSTLVLLAVGVVIGVSIAVATSWLCKSRCAPWHYTAQPPVLGGPVTGREEKAAARTPHSAIPASSSGYSGQHPPPPPALGLP
ncbi:ICOS ligand [Sorex fumeus]|uniref:ICOS ligand n=1 Tax=Sorex fumeus TaxID=62283 RepID=UPI0024ACA270|nr:ICOS ligand [Sorex fumeus]